MFNTAMTGYQEILTDPSYAKQLVMLTTAHVGNTGWNQDDNESSRIWACGLIVRESASLKTHHRATHSLSEMLIAQGVPAIAGIDTRHLTLLLRDQGSLGAAIVTDVSRLEEAKHLADSFGGMAGQALTAHVSCQSVQAWDQGWDAQAFVEAPPCERTRPHVLVYDFGVKHSILRALVSMGCQVTVLPAATPPEEALALTPDGIVLSNGPGDPATCLEAIEAARYFFKNKIPVLGICLGFQIIALALGARVYKMKFGHHGANHPVAGDAVVYVTSQNHGFAVEEPSLPSDVMVTHRSLFDGSLQGFRHQSLPIMGFQGHPEAGPGPHDMLGLFEKFRRLL